MISFWISVVPPKMDRAFGVLGRRMMLEQYQRGSVPAGELDLAWQDGSPCSYPHQCAIAGSQVSLPSELIRK
jgi:hypothetical protein